MASWKLLFVFSAIVATTFATEVEQCPGGATPKLESVDVKLTKCEQPPCILKRRTTVGIGMKIRPQKDVESLTTSVQGIISDVPLPFVGVDGTSACENIFSADGKTKVGCPLKAGETYVYKNSFPVHLIYPPVSLTVHWALQDANNKDVTCFEVEAKIK